MIFANSGPRVFGLPPGADFPARLVDGLRDRMAARPPEDMARVTLFLNTQRMRRRVQEAFVAKGSAILPKLRIVTDLGSDPLLIGPEKALSSLGRRLELTVLIDRLLATDSKIAPRSALFDLADSLGALLDEMRGEGVSPADIKALDVSRASEHWARTLRFVDLVSGFFADDSRPDSETRQRLATEALVARWTADPPQDPVIIAGSTGSRGTTQLLMRAAAQLPQGALVLPGFDTDLPAAVWEGMADSLTHEDHPQFRFRSLLSALGLNAAEVQAWEATPPPAPARNRLVSLSLRPAPVTDQWIAEGAGLDDLAQATAAVTLIQAQTPRQEATSIALILRGAIETGRRAALISPDRDLTRRVAAALDRWGLRPDDSAGQPLQQSAPGRLLRLTANAMGVALSSDQLLTILKHPLCFSGSDRGEHLRLSRDLELHLRRQGPAFPTSDFLTGWAGAQGSTFAADWARALAGVMDGLATATAGGLTDLVGRHRSLTETLAAGPGPEAASGGLWDKAAGQEALAALTELQAEAPAQCHLSLADYAILINGVLSRREVRDAVLADDRVMILGTQEARIERPDLVILGGLNEGSWPGQPAPDPWLNRELRAAAGLLLPDRRIGLSAHDYQIAMGAPEVVLTRAVRDADSATVPSRWLNRLMNLLDGLPEKGGPAALAAMVARGKLWLGHAAEVEAPIAADLARRPSPRPPVQARPNRLSLTQIATLVRDPYAIYARHVLSLRPLNPLRPVADSRLRGEVLHRVPEAFVKAGPPADVAKAAALLLQITDEMLERAVGWPSTRAIWRSRMEQIALPFASLLAASAGTPVSVETMGAVRLDDLDFTLIGKPDRIDLLPDGALQIVDYKTGDPPSASKQKHFEKQLLLAAVMASMGGFAELGPRHVARIVYLGLKPGLKDETTDLTEEMVAEVLADFRKLIASYRVHETGYTSRRAMFETDNAGDYDDLARLGEWSHSDTPEKEDVG